jgi:hypothetical protein
MTSSPNARNRLLSRIRDLKIDPDSDFDGGEIYHLTDVGSQP